MARHIDTQSEGGEAEYIQCINILQVREGRLNTMYKHTLRIGEAEYDVQTYSEDRGG